MSDATGTATPKPLLAWAKWPGLAVMIAGFVTLLYGVFAVEDSGCGSYVGDVSSPGCQFATPPGIFAILGAVVVILGIIAVVIGFRAKSA
jgi:hypothetical protein